MCIRDRYRGINVPIGESNTVANGTTINASIVESIAVTNRSLTGATFTGRIESDVASANTWFVIRTGNEISNTNECENFARRSERVLTNTNRQNQLNVNDLTVNTKYTVTFCVQRTSNSAIVELSERFQTLRSSTTLVVHDCRDNTVFRASDGPLNIRILDSDINTIQDSSQVVITNFSTVDLSYRFTESLFDAQTVGVRSVPAGNVRTDNVQPRLIADERVVSYGVRIFGGENWTAQFSCRNLFCSTIGNPTGTTFDIATGRCDDISPIR